MADLKGSKTEQNLKDAFAGESQANRRYLYFAQKADVEGYNDVSTVFRSTAEGETGHAHGHLEYLEETGDPATDLPIGRTGDNLKAAVAGETHEYTDMYPGMAKTAREEGFDEIADWFETLPRPKSPTPGASRKRSTNWTNGPSVTKSLWGGRHRLPLVFYHLNWFCEHERRQPRSPHPPPHPLAAGGFLPPGEAR